MLFCLRLKLNQNLEMNLRKTMVNKDKIMANFLGINTLLQNKKTTSNLHNRAKSISSG